MPDIGVPELIIIAVIVLLVFGPGKAAELGSALGKGIREFRQATREEETTSSTTMLTPTSGPADASGAPAAVARYCVRCGTGAAEGQKFCTECGASLTAKAS